LPMKVLSAFLLRDFRIYKSYKLGFVVRAFQAFFTLASFFFIGKLIHPHSPQVLIEYGGEYFPFVIIGLAYSRYLGIGLSSLGGLLREEQLQGTLEYLLTTPAGFFKISAGLVSWEFIWASAEVILYILFGVFVFGFDMGNANFLSAFFVFLLSLAALFSLGVMSAAFTLLFKDADAFDWVLGGLMRFACGVYFPAAMLPAWLYKVSLFLPVTYALDGLRQAIILGKSVADLAGILLMLLGFSLLLWPLAIAVFAFSIRRLKVTGTLGFR
jgi:ABC-2 type transport system permease protein